MNLYSEIYLPEYKGKMDLAIDNIRQIISDYGITYAIKIYYNIIDLSKAQLKKDQELQKIVQENIQKLLDEIKTKPDLTAFEAITYFKRNEKGKWQEYNNLLRQHFSEDYKEILKRSEEYRQSNPDYVKIYESEY